jgi:hypothetical protein
MEEVWVIISLLCVIKNYKNLNKPQLDLGVWEQIILFVSSILFCYTFSDGSGGRSNRLYLSSFHASMTYARGVPLTAFMPLFRMQEGFLFFSRPYDVCKRVPLFMPLWRMYEGFLFSRPDVCKRGSFFHAPMRMQEVFLFNAPTYARGVPHLMPLWRKQEGSRQHLRGQIS